MRCSLLSQIRFNAWPSGQATALLSLWFEGRNQGNTGNGSVLFWWAQVLGETCAPFRVAAIKFIGFFGIPAEELWLRETSARWIRCPLALVALVAVWGRGIRRRLDLTT